jgi:hypothetical protein
MLGCEADRKPEPLDYLILAAFDIKVDRKSKFPVLLLAIATVCPDACDRS